MGIPELQPNNAIDVEGIEIFGTDSGISKDSTAYKTPNLYRQPGLTIREVAKVLNISTNTVRSKIKSETLYACKVKGPNGEEWRVFLDGPPKAPFVDPITHTAPSQATPASAELNKLIDLVQKQSEKLEAAAGHIGYLKAQLESSEQELARSQETIKQLTDRTSTPNQNQTWWHKFASWFFLSKEG